MARATLPRPPSSSSLSFNFEASEKAAAAAVKQMTDQMPKLNWSHMDTPEKVFTQSETVGQFFHAYNQLEVDAGDWGDLIQRGSRLK